MLSESNLQNNKTKKKTMERPNIFVNPWIKKMTNERAGYFCLLFCKSDPRRKYFVCFSSPWKIVNLLNAFLLIHHKSFFVAFNLILSIWCLLVYRKPYNSSIANAEDGANFVCWWNRGRRRSCFIRSGAAYFLLAWPSFSGNF